MKLILTILLFSFIGQANAFPLFDKIHNKKCKKYVNLLRHKWGVKREIPNLDQGPVGICYSYTAISLIDLWRDIHGPKLFKKLALSSPQYGALLTRLVDGNDRSDFNGGDGRNTIEAIRKYGMCRFDVIDSIMRKYSKSHNITAKNWYIITQWFLEFYDGSIKRELEASYNKAKTLKNIFGRFKNRNDIKEIYKNGDFLKIYSSIKPYLKKQDYKGFMKNVFYQCFREKNIYSFSKRLPKIISKGLYFPAVGKALKIIAELDKKNPVAITYKAEFLKQKNKRLTRIKNYFKAPNHQSLLAGKRVRDGKCQFLLKNSWGNYCGYRWECQKDKNGKEIGVWVGANALMMATSNIYYFDIKK
jgi:hypothetical protein